MAVLKNGVPDLKTIALNKNYELEERQFMPF